MPRCCARAASTAASPCSRPTAPGREKILEVHTRSVPLAPDVDLGRIASTTPGMVGADLANLVNEAALLAARRNHDAGDGGRLHRLARADRARRRAAGDDEPGRQAPHRLPRGRPRARRDAHRRRRPGAEDLDHPARLVARRHVLGARRRPVQLRAAASCSPRSRWRSAAASPRRSSTASRPPAPNRTSSS